jgi:3-oxoacyl-[acyl-carrier protein] reductase
VTPGVSCDLTGKVVVVTGGTRGIGKEITRVFIAAGARVAAIYREDSSAACALQDELGEAGASLMLLKGSITDRDFVEAAVKECVTKWGRLDCLVNNAGIHRDALVAMMSEQQWDDVVETNLKGVYVTCRCVVRTMIAQRSGAIINISSLSALLGREGQANYAASKAGVLALTRSLAREVGRYGIRVNAIVAGITDTSMMRNTPPKALAAILEAVPLGRMAAPKEIANVALFLASELASYVTGGWWEVTGGL